MIEEKQRGDTMKMPDKGTDWDNLAAEMINRGSGDAKWREGKTAVYVFNAGEDVARSIQLALEYDPAPPFSGGTPASAPDAILSNLRARVYEKAAT